MKLWCLPFMHDYTCVNVRYYRDTSYNNDTGIPSSCIVYRCKKCGKLKTKDMYGVVVTKEQVNTGKGASLHVSGSSPPKSE